MGAVRTPRTSDPSCRGYEAAYPEAKAPCGMGQPRGTVQAEVPDSASLSPGEHLRSGLSGVGLGLLQPPSQLRLGASPSLPKPLPSESRSQSPTPSPTQGHFLENPTPTKISVVFDKQRPQSLHQFPPSKVGTIRGKHRVTARMRWGDV